MAKTNLKTVMLDYIIHKVEYWLKTGNMDDTDILSNNFQFVSPFWQGHSKAEFVENLVASNDYREKSLSKIEKFHCVIKLKSDDQRYFTLFLQYETKKGDKVDEVVIGRVENEKLIMLRSIYDLNKTKKALNL